MVSGIEFRAGAQVAVGQGAKGLVDDCEALRPRSVL